MDEQTTKRSEEMDLFFELSADLLCVSDFDGCFLLLSPSWEKALGFTVADLQSRPYDDLIHPDDLNATRECTTILSQRKTSITFRNRYRCRDGSYRWLRWSSTSDVGRRRIYSVARDITEIYKLQYELQELNQTLEDRVNVRTEALRQSNEMLHSIIAASPQPIIAVDNDRNVRVWNPAAERTFGWAADEVVGRKVPFLATEDERESSRLFNERALSGEHFSNLELRRTRHDGVPVDLLVSTATTYDGEGRVDGFVSIANDVTQHKKIEQQLLRAQRLESLGTLAGGIAHDLNNVLAPIAMSLDLFRVKFADSEMNRTLDLLDSCVHRGSDWIPQILHFTDWLQGDRLPVQTKRLLLETEKVLVRTLPKSIVIKLEMPRALWVIAADPTQLHQVMMNLCINARDAMPRGGQLTLKAGNVVLDEGSVKEWPGMTSGSYVAIEVRDTGHGIPPEIQEEIFEPFFTTKEVGHGTGLGLSTVAAIVRNHSGCIRVRSEVGAGTSFSILLPALPGQRFETKVPGDRILPAGNDELILVVEDEAAVRDITKLTLETHGYRVLVAANGAEGIELYMRHQDQISLVISDTDMPLMDGWEMIRSLRKINPAVRVISASGLASSEKDEEDSNGPMASASRVLLTKPFTTEQLLRTVREVIHAV